MKTLVFAASEVLLVAYGGTKPFLQFVTYQRMYELKYKPWTPKKRIKPLWSLPILHLGHSPACYGAPRSPAAETAPPAPTPGSAGSSSPPPPPPPQAVWMTGGRTTLTETASPSPRGCVLEEKPLNQALQKDTVHPPDAWPDVAAAEALRADSSGGSLWRCGERQRSVVGLHGFVEPPLLGLWWSSSLQV